MSSDAGGTDNEAGTTADSAGSGGSVESNPSGGTTFYLPCESLEDCAMFGGGKVGCVAGPMHFCTKPSACPGETLP